MQPLLDDDRLQATVPPLPPDPQGLLAQARALRSAAQAGALQPLLRGKRLGLLCEDEAGEDAELFRHAAQELGADVAHIRPSLSSLSSGRQVEHTARVLGRLYDALECQGMARELVDRIRLKADVPVYDGLASVRHPSAGLASQLDPEVPAADARRYLLQAALIASLV
jgi:ornithine carbamoyltransferase